MFITTLFFFFNDTATTEIYTLSLHDALPIFAFTQQARDGRDELLSLTVVDLTIPLGEADRATTVRGTPAARPDTTDRKSTRLNSSHANISYAVFCLKKKNKAPIVIDVTIVTQ